MAEAMESDGYMRTRDEPKQYSSHLDLHYHLGNIFLKYRVLSVFLSHPWVFYSVVKTWTQEYAFETTLHAVLSHPSGLS